MKKNFILAIALLLFVGVACKKLMPGAPEDAEILDGPIEGLTDEQRRIFLAGDIAFNDEVFTPETGLGPIFVTNSCGACHAGDGKGHPSTILTRFLKYDGLTYDYLLDKGGPQLQHRAIPGHSGELIPNEATGIAQFIAPPVTGLGLLSSIPDADILALEDPTDSDGDGISGVANYITPPDFFIPQAHHLPNGGKYIGRFGRKAGAIDLLQQTVGAYKQDMGITSDFDMEDPINPLVSGLQTDNVPDPEIPASTIHNVVFYLRTLKAPIQRNQNDADVIAGKTIFTNIGCVKCHTPEFTTGVSDIAALSNKKIYPYTDLLMHDMGQGLDDQYTEGTAETYEWKTPALWGLGLSKNSQGGAYHLLHDGRAKSIQQAIEMHGGEGANSRNAFMNLSQQDKDKLIKFLESL